VRTSIEATRKRTGWPLTALIVGMPIWWVLGLSAFVWIIFSVPMLIGLLRRTPIRVPRGFGLWLMFLAWMIFSATQVSGVRYLSFGYRGLLYVAATIIFLFVYNQTEEELPRSRILGLATIYFLWGTIGGYLGLILGEVGFTSLVEMLLPDSLLNNSLAKDLVHPIFAQDQDFLGFVLSRPAAPFIYTNEWGATMAVLLPIVVAGWSGLARRWRGWSMILVIAFLAPAILSVNRGLWLLVAVSLVYGAGLLAVRGGSKHVGALAVGAVLIAALALLSPLSDVVQGRLDSPHSNNARLGLYRQVIERIPESPIFGFGAPTVNVERPLQPAVGTHGQFWMVLYSHGIPAALAFVAFMFSLLKHTFRRRDSVGTWLHVCVALVPIMMWFYEMLAPPLFVIMIAAAASLRDPAWSRPPPVYVNDGTLRSVLASTR